MHVKDFFISANETTDIFQFKCQSDTLKESNKDKITNPYKVYVFDML